VEIEDADKREQVNASNIIIATGSEPALLPAFNIDRKNVLTSDQALNLDEIPESILIVGAGGIGIEFGCFFSTFGSKVTIVEALPQVLPTLRDAKLATDIEKIFSKKGIQIRVKTRVDKVEVKGDKKVLTTLNGDEVLESERVLVSIGRKLNSDDIGD